MRRPLKAFVILALACAAAAPAMAQEATQVRPLMGGVNFNANGYSAPMRLQRNVQSATPLSAAVSDVLSALRQQAGRYDNVVDSSAFASAVRNSTLMGGAAQTTPQPAAAEAPYVWYQSAQGGYFDGSGTYKAGTVWADKLYLYGGKFQDGTPVPKHPITAMNSMGHAYRTSETDTSHFLYR